YCHRLRLALAAVAASDSLDESGYRCLSRARARARTIFAGDYEAATPRSICVVVVKEPPYLNRLAGSNDCITRPRRLRLGPANVWSGSACTNGCAFRNYRRPAWTHVQLPFAHTFRARWNLQKPIYLGRHYHRGPAPV